MIAVRAGGRFAERMQSAGFPLVRLPRLDPRPTVDLAVAA